MELEEPVAAPRPPSPHPGQPVTKPGLHHHAGHSHLILLSTFPVFPRRFVTRADLSKLGLDHLMGTPLLRAYMHGFFVDNRLYNKVGRGAAAGRLGGWLSGGLSGWPGGEGGCWGGWAGPGGILLGRSTHPTSQPTN